jgi:hypothetical protein
MFSVLFLLDAKRTRIRISTNGSDPGEVQKHMGSPDSDPDPQHCSAFCT